MQCEEELKSKIERQFELNTLLDLNKKDEEVLVAEYSFTEEQKEVIEIEDEMAESIFK
ncbi:hypothetical protein [Marinisporobacter balticus]|uniref:hypothetical protein n=1 Tax=Marinisporobacter balticus TaxID=2018667 RepID=UPI0014043116|nr:hypothetical protein [Marinisporobacter balticus]